jgi:hypothetical protein
MINRTTVLAAGVVLVSSCAAWSAGKLTTDQVELCGEDAVKLCAASGSIDKARACLLRRIKKVAPSCAYLLRRADIRRPTTSSQLAMPCCDVPSTAAPWLRSHGVTCLPAESPGNNLRDCSSGL